MKKVFKVTTSYVDHLGQTRLVYCFVDEQYMPQYCKNAKIEGYAVESIEERR